MVEKTESKKYHTDAIYRCRIIENKHNYYLIKQCAIWKNNGDKKSLYIPQNNIYLKKSLVEEKLSPGDYVAITLELIGKKTNVTNVTEVTKTLKYTNSNKKVLEKTEVYVEKQQKNSNNMFSALYTSDSD